MHQLTIEQRIDNLQEQIDILDSKIDRLEQQKKAINKKIEKLSKVSTTTYCTTSSEVSRLNNFQVR